MQRKIISCGTWIIRSACRFENTRIKRLYRNEILLETTASYQVHHGGSVHYDETKGEKKRERCYRLLG